MLRPCARCAAALAGARAAAPRAASSSTGIISRQSTPSFSTSAPRARRPQSAIALRANVAALGGSPVAQGATAAMSSALLGSRPASRIPPAVVLQQQICARSLHSSSAQRSVQTESSASSHSVAHVDLTGASDVDSTGLQTASGTIAATGDTPREAQLTPSPRASHGKTERVGAAEEAPGTDGGHASSSGSDPLITFQDLGVPRRLISRLSKAGIVQPTEIQRKVWLVTYTARDCAGCARARVCVCACVSGRMTFVCSAPPPSAPRWMRGPKRT